MGCRVPMVLWSIISDTSVITGYCNVRCRLPVMPLSGCLIETYQLPHFQLYNCNLEERRRYECLLEFSTFCKTFNFVTSDFNVLKADLSINIDYD